MDEEGPFVPYMLMMGTIGMTIPGPGGSRIYYAPAPGSYRPLPEDAPIKVIGGDALIEAFEIGDAIVDDDGFAYLME